MWTSLISRSRRQVSNPSIPGSPRSRITAIGLTSLKTSSARSPSTAVSTANPSDSSEVWISRVTSGASSTRSSLGLSIVGATTLIEAYCRWSRLGMTDAGGRCLLVRAAPEMLVHEDFHQRNA